MGEASALSNAPVKVATSNLSLRTPSTLHFTAAHHAVQLERVSRYPSDIDSMPCLLAPIHLVLTDRAHFVARFDSGPRVLRTVNVEICGLQAPCSAARRKLHCASTTACHGLSDIRYGPFATANYVTRGAQ